MWEVKNRGNGPNGAMQVAWNGEESCSPRQKVSIARAQLAIPADEWAIKREREREREERGREG